MWCGARLANGGEPADVIPVILVPVEVQVPLRVVPVEIGHVAVAIQVAPDRAAVIVQRTIHATAP